MALSRKERIQELADTLEALHRSDEPSSRPPSEPAYDSSTKVLLGALRDSISRETEIADRHMRVVDALLKRFESKHLDRDTRAPRQRSLSLSCPAAGRSTGRFYLRNEFGQTRTFEMHVRWETDSPPLHGLLLSPQQSAIACGYDLPVDFELDLAGSALLPGSTLQGLIEVAVDGLVRAVVWVDVDVTSGESPQ